MLDSSSRHNTWSQSLYGNQRRTWRALLIMGNIDLFKIMNIDWDEELAQYFHPQYLKAHKKLNSNTYSITTLEGVQVQFQCSIQGYSCKCHGRKYELPMGLLKEHSKEYVRAFNHELNLKLQALASQQDEEQDDQ